MKISICAALACSLIAATPAIAAPHQSAAIQVESGWIRWLPGDLPAAGYLTIRNSSNWELALVSEESPEYRNVMLHRSVEKNGVEHMEMVPRLTIPAHGSVAISPGNYHLMLMHARHALHPGDDVHMTLHFSDGEVVKTLLKVRLATQLN